VQDVPKTGPQTTIRSAPALYWLGLGACGVAPVLGAFHDPLCELSSGVAHTERCSNSPAAASRCECSCDGVWHGSALPDTPTPAYRPAAPAGGEIAPAVENELLESLAELILQGIAEPGDGWAIALESVSDTLSKNIVDAANKLSRHDGQKLRRRLKHVHWLCELCAEILRAGSLAQDAKAQLVDSITALIMEGAGAWSNSRAARVVVKALVKGQIDALTTITNVDQMVLVLRLVGIASCPAIERHPKVYDLCVQPLLHALTKSLILRWLLTRSNEFGMSESQRQSVEDAADEALVS
jgi:hypothetical protein